MANSELYGKSYQIPMNVLKHIQKALISNSMGNGIKRAKYLLKNGTISYQAMKRLKNFFDYFNSQKDGAEQYELAGGDLMKNFIEQTLNSDRNAIKQSKEIKKDTNVNVNLGTKAYQTPRLNEDENKIKRNAVVIIVNDENKILLLKRTPDSNWGANAWAFVGGGIEKNETPEKAVKREAEEEIGIQLDKLIKSFEIEIFPDDFNYVFVCRYSGDPMDIKLNDEHTHYGWYSISEIKFLDVVPNLMNYLELAFKKQ